MAEATLPIRRPEDLVKRPEQVAQREAIDTVRKIVDDVRANGENAVRMYAARFDNRAPADPLFYHRSAMTDAWTQTTSADQRRLERIAGRIRRFAEAQRASIADVTVDVPGGMAGHTVRPMDRAGCYAPAGHYPLPSSLLMACVTAKAAGVREVWVATPAPSRIMLAAAYVAGADGLLAAGGAQAIAALAYGAGELGACNVVVGPGNRYVTAAKRRVSGDVAIDMAAGPSELVIIADETANPSYIAADLLGQAEHDPDAWPVLLTTSDALVTAVQRELHAQLGSLETAPIARKALRNGGACILTDIREAIVLSDDLAPEHVQVCTRNAGAVARSLRNYGALFIGEGSPEVLGDYGIGPNHVLPTSGVARSFGGLSVFTFLRVNTWLECTGPMDSTLREDVLWLAGLEGLRAHARAIEQREDVA